ncbi:hypothetical protein BC936DRAFT_146967 [Jimgerdemannia flammicorona]|uniref:N-acetyltransferase domain-containing protein n=1 Tax=Jimgerdemannia flammicorona TaxID=994334 RepID=A0A433D6J1_9FUNG|nr:hypothetical protein BC936DRAFT_146967 [Jimgerdemannia flammicorona]
MEGDNNDCTSTMYRILTVERLVVFIAATLSASPESTRSHDPAGRTVLVRSVVVDPGFRRRGITSRCLQAYVGEFRKHNRVMVFSRKELVPFYEKSGFVMKGKSLDVDGTTDELLEMVLEL